MLHLWVKMPEKPFKRKAQTTRVLTVSRLQSVLTWLDCFGTKHHGQGHVVKQAAHLMSDRKQRISQERAKGPDVPFEVTCRSKQSPLTNIPIPGFWGFDINIGTFGSIFLETPMFSIGLK